MIELPRDELLIGGEWRRGSGAPLRPANPATGEVLTEIRGASAADVAEAVERGALAAADPAWRGLLPHQRARYLHAIADAIEADGERLAVLQTLNTGKTLTETRALVASAAATFRYCAALCETLEDALTPPRGRYLTMSLYEPIGVVGAITPWNSPIASEAQKVAPALAAGNAVVLKPAEWTPLVALAVGRLVMDAGLPAGLLSVLPGEGPAAGDALVRHAKVGKVSFTGGTATGTSIARIAAAKLMPVTLELGGKSPVIVFEDADVEKTLAGVLFGIFSSTGQSCVAGSRLFVAERLYRDFVTELVERTRKLRVGPGAEPDTQVGPLITEEHRKRVASYVDLARGEGGEVRCGGEPPERPGFYYLPTVIEGLSNDARVCQEEIFGPVLVCLPFADEAEVIAQANQSVYGLACGIWTRDWERAWRVARAIEAGTVWINTFKQFSASTPFGGMKQSGFGREKGRDWIRGYMRQKGVYWGMEEAPLPGDSEDLDFGQRP